LACAGARKGALNLWRLQALVLRFVGKAFRRLHFVKAGSPGGAYQRVARRLDRHHNGCVSLSEKASMSAQSPQVHSPATRRILDRIELLQLALQLQLDELDEETSAQVGDLERMLFQLRPSACWPNGLSEVILWIGLPGLMSCLATCAFAFVFLR
jgi:hypothetical protein